MTERGIWAYHVQDVTIRSSLDKVQLSVGVGIRCSGARRDVEWVVECVSEDRCAMLPPVLANNRVRTWGVYVHILEGISHVGDVSHLLGAEPVAVVHLEVVPVRPFSAGTVAVVCVVLDGQVVLGCPLKVWETDHLAQLGKGSGSDVADHILEPRLRPAQKRSSSEDTVRCDSRSTKQKSGTHCVGMSGLYNAKDQTMDWRTMTYIKRWDEQLKQDKRRADRPERRRDGGYLMYRDS